MNTIEQAARRFAHLPAHVPDFAVVGGGLCGRLVAWQLAGAGHRVALYERGDAMGTQSAAWVAAAMLAPLAEASSAELLITGIGAASLETLADAVAEFPDPVFLPAQRDARRLARGRPRRSALFERRRRANAPAALFDNGFVKLSGARSRRRSRRSERASRRAACCPTKASSTTGRCCRRWRRVLASAACRPTGTPRRHHARRALRDRLPRPRRQAAWPALRGIRGEVARVHAPGVGLPRPTRLCIRATRSTSRQAGRPVRDRRDRDRVATTCRRPACARRSNC